MEAIDRDKTLIDIRSEVCRHCKGQFGTGDEKCNCVVQKVVNVIKRQETVKIEN